MLDFTDGPYSGLSSPQASLHFPDVVAYADVAEALSNTPEAELILGVDGNGDRVSVNLTSDSPHVLVSAGSGAGKSVIARSLATQALLKGYTVIVLDIKRISHMWAKGLPGVHYASSATEIGNALTSVAMEVHRRMEAIEASPFGTEAEIGPRVLVIYEEMNSTVDTLKTLDKQLPPRGVYRAQDAFGDIMNLGRAAKVHVVGFAQYADTHTLPTRYRESFGWRVLIKHSSNAWNMLAWQCGYCPPAPQKVGRGYAVQGDRAIQTQFLYLSEEHCAQLVREARTEVPRVRRRDARRQDRDARRALYRARQVR